jgi:geranylgeranyl pyrophosphate synthase
MESSGARAEIEQAIQRLTARAIDAVRTAPVDGAAADALVDLAWFVATRNR